MNPRQTRASTGAISSANLVSVRRDKNYDVTVSNRPILLKKSAMVCASEKYASEIEIFTFGRFRTRISRSSTQKRCFYPSLFERFGQTDFFNRIGQKETFEGV